MAPTTNKEHQILTSFLLPPAPLPSIITLEQFASFFPPSASESEIQKLFRHLTHTRSLTIDAVAENIDDEVRRGISQKRAVVRGRRLAEQDEVEDEEILVEQQVSNLPGEGSVNDTVMLTSE